MAIRLDRRDAAIEMTRVRFEIFQEVVESADFLEKDADTIFHTLKEHLDSVPFSFYLRRFVFLNSHRFPVFRSFFDFSDEDCIETVIDAFRDSGTPASIHRSDVRLRGRVTSWFHQATVRRETVLLLGFALRMKPEEVNEFMTKALHEAQLDEEDPREAICLYCYKNKYRFSRMERLLRSYEDGRAGRSIAPEQHAWNNLPLNPEDEKLVRHLLSLSVTDGLTTQKTRIRQTFRQLYDAVECLIRADIPPNFASSVLSGHRGRTLEDLLYASVPRDRHGNLVSDLQADIQAEILGHRLTRQHLYELRHNIVEPNRYDLLTLKFLLSAEGPDRVEDRKQRFERFFLEASDLLASCGLGEVYFSDPYEVFLLMCMLSIDPLGTYSDVLKMAYTKPDNTPAPDEQPPKKILIPSFPPRPVIRPRLRFRPSGSPARPTPLPPFPRE